MIIVPEDLQEGFTAYKHDDVIKNSKRDFSQKKTVIPKSVSNTDSFTKGSGNQLPLFNTP